MTVGELERYILSKNGARKKAIPEWRYIRYTIYQSLFAAVEEVHGEVYCSLFGVFPDIRAKYPDCVVPAVQLNEEYSSVLLSGELPDTVLYAMVDSAFEARCARFDKVEISQDGEENVPYGSERRVIFPKDAVTAEDGEKFQSYSVDSEYDADIARYVDLWRAVVNERLSQKETAATNDRLYVEDNGKGRNRGNGR